MKIDVISILISSIITGFGFFIALFLIWGFYFRKKELFWWWLSELTYVSGLVLLTGRDSVPDLVSIIIGNAFLLLNFVFVWFGVSAYEGEKPHFKTGLFIIALFILFVIYFTYFDSNIAAGL
jgi:hypothetical protein